MKQLFDDVSLNVATLVTKIIKFLLISSLYAITKYGDAIYSIYGFVKL
jgi:hypothetical protein